MCSASLVPPVRLLRRCLLRSLYRSYSVGCSTVSVAGFLLVALLPSPLLLRWLLVASLVVFSLFSCCTHLRFVASIFAVALPVVALLWSVFLLLAFSISLFTFSGSFLLSPLIVLVASLSDSCLLLVTHPGNPAGFRSLCSTESRFLALALLALLSLSLLAPVAWNPFSLTFLVSTGLALSPHLRTSSLQLNNQPFPLYYPRCIFYRLLWAIL